MTSYTTNAAYPYPSATDQLVDYPTTAGSLAGYLDFLPNRNRIINGAFDIWQRGGGGFIATDGMYTADQWRYSQTGAGGTHTITRVDQPTGSTLIAGMNPRYYLRLSNTVIGSATAQIIGQRIEDVRTLAGEQCTLSAWIKGTATGITAKAVQNFGTGGSPSSAVTTTLGTATPTTSWVRLQVHFTMPSLSGKTIGTGENSFVEIQFDCGASLGTLDLWGVQLEQNTTQTAFEREPMAITLLKCQRYYEKSFNMEQIPANNPTDKTGWVGAQAIASTNYLLFPRVNFAAVKNKIPTITFYNPGSGTAGNACNTNALATSYPVITNHGALGSSISTSGFHIQVNNTTTVGTDIAIHWAGSSEL